MNIRFNIRDMYVCGLLECIENDLNQQLLWIKIKYLFIIYQNVVMSKFFFSKFIDRCLQMYIMLFKLKFLYIYVMKLGVIYLEWLGINVI